MHALGECRVNALPGTPDSTDGTTTHPTRLFGLELHSPARVTCPRTRHAFRRPARITDQCTRTRTRRAAAGAGSPSIAGITVSDAADHGRRSERPCAAVGSIVRGAERPPKAGRPDHGSTKTMCSDCGITRAQSPLCAHLKSVSA